MPYLIMANPNASQTFAVGGCEKTLIPTGGSGGVSFANLINALTQAGWTDVRSTMNVTTQVYALQALPWAPDSPTSNTGNSIHPFADLDPNLLPADWDDQLARLDAWT